MIESNEINTARVISPSRTKTIKVGIRTWDALKRKKGPNETFDDVILATLNEKTASVGDEGAKAIKYKRKTEFFDDYTYGEEIGFEYEYNDVKSNQSDFVLDLKIKKVFLKKSVLNPSEFFGVDNSHKHYSNYFLSIYLKAVALALEREFRAKFYAGKLEDYDNIASWRKLYYSYNLSEDSFRDDIETPLRLNEGEKAPKEWAIKVQASKAQMLINEYEKLF